jgi:hypothetical protein
MTMKQQIAAAWRQINGGTLLDAIDTESHYCPTIRPPADGENPVAVAELAARAFDAQCVIRGQVRRSFHPINTKRWPSVVEAIRKQMEAQHPSKFKHTTLTAYPDKVVGITLLDESPGFTGIYLRDENGGLWPARTVDRGDSNIHRHICNAWLQREGKHEDKRSVR